MAVPGGKLPFLCVGVFFVSVGKKRVSVLGVTN